jgi:hypothetical protein
VTRVCRNIFVRRFGAGPVEALTRQQLANRAAYLRQHGRRIEALRLTQAWIAAKKVRP